MAHSMRVKGFSRIKIGSARNGKLQIDGESDWTPNTITEIGIRDGIARLFAGSAGSQLGQSLILGTQTNAVQSSQTALSGQGAAAGQWRAANKSTSTGAGPAGTYQMTATFAGSDWNSNIAAVAVASATNGSILSGNTFSGGSSSFDTGQTASVTYEWQVS